MNGQEVNPGTVRSRIAPTPSGYLHEGNALNFLITWMLVRREGGRLKLRIDDADCERSRREYIEDIFRQLEWLGLDWDEGPQGPDDFHRHHSQKLRFPRYRQAMEQLFHDGHCYPCGCSRKEIRERAPDGIYPGFCRPAGDMTASAGQPECAVRLLVPEESRIRLGDQVIALSQVMGDFVLWRKDGLPSYQLASLIDDLDDHITHIVRGEDLIHSTAAQLFLARQLGEERFSRVRFFHHPLLAGRDGRKLSKSRQAQPLFAHHGKKNIRQVLYQRAATFLSLDPKSIDSADSPAALAELADNKLSPPD